MLVWMLSRLTQFSHKEGRACSANTDENTDNDLLPRESKISRRGMHSATGAFWDNTKDGCWSFKYEKGEGKGFDVVVSVTWVSVD